MPNDERQRANQRAWRQANAERVKAYAREYGPRWDAANREKRRQYDRKWRRNNPEKVAAKNARRRKLVELSPETIHAAGEYQNWRCAYCHTDISNEYHVDHIDPVARGGTNDPDNIALACPTCNLRKGVKPLYEFAGMAA